MGQEQFAFVSCARVRRYLNSNFGSEVDTSLDKWIVDIKKLHRVKVIVYQIFLHYGILFDLSRKEEKDHWLNMPQVYKSGLNITERLKEAIPVIRLMIYSAYTNYILGRLLFMLSVLRK